MNWQGYFISKIGKIETLPIGGDHTAHRPAWYKQGRMRIRIYGGGKYSKEGKIAIEVKRITEQQSAALSLWIGAELASNYIYEIIYAAGDSAPLIVSAFSRLRKFESGA
jgi:hypothetical protein